MEVRVRFFGGPLDGQVALTDGLSSAKVFFDQKARSVFIYLRVDELVYAFNPEQSEEMTQDFDGTLAYFNVKEADSIRFEE